MCRIGKSIVRISLLFWAAVALAAAPQRIVSTSPSVTEILYALGLGDRVVGVTTYCHYPPEAAKKPKIGDYLNPNLEAIMALRPDLVIAEASGVHRVSILSSLKIKTLEIDDGTVNGIYESVRRIGVAAGVPDRAIALDARIHAALDDVRARTAKLPRRRVVFVVGRTPGRVEGLVVAGKGSYLDEVMRVAGGINVFGDTIAPYSKVATEDLLARDPDVIVDMGDMAQTVGVTPEQKRAVVVLWNQYGSLTAVKRHQVFVVTPDIFAVPGPRVMEAAREFERMFHGER